MSVIYIKLDIQMQHLVERSEYIDGSLVSHTGPDDIDTVAIDISTQHFLNQDWHVLFDPRWVGGFAGTPDNEPDGYNEIQFDPETYFQAAYQPELPAHLTAFHSESWQAGDLDGGTDNKTYFFQGYAESWSDVQTGWIEHHNYIFSAVYEGYSTTRPPDYNNLPVNSVTPPQGDLIPETYEWLDYVWVPVEFGARLTIENASLHDLPQPTKGFNPKQLTQYKNSRDLQYLSADANNPWQDKTTEVYAGATITGEAQDKIKDLKLEVVINDNVIATLDLAIGKLSNATKAALGKDFGSNGITFGEDSLVFTLKGEQAAAVERFAGKMVDLRLVATSEDGGRDTTDDTDDSFTLRPSVTVLQRYEGKNRFSLRDDDITKKLKDGKEYFVTRDEGGDDWAMPSTIKFLHHFRKDFAVNDIASMNGGYFWGHAGSKNVPNSGHRNGLEFDGRWAGLLKPGGADEEDLKVSAVDAHDANKLLHILRDDAYGRMIGRVYIDFFQGDSFYDRLEGKRAHGRLVTDMVIADTDHWDHFHFDLSRDWIA